MNMFLSYAVTLLSIYASYVFLYISWSVSRRYAWAARNQGCKAAPMVRSWDPLLGIDTFVALRKADFAGRRSEIYKKLHLRYGHTFLMKPLGVVELQTSNSQNIQAICTSQFEDFGVGPMRGAIGEPFLSHGIFTDDGDFWKRSRALVRPTFSRKEISDLGNFESFVVKFLALIPKDGSEFDLLPLSKKLFLDTSSDFLFGRSMESLDPDSNAETDEFITSFDRSLLGLALLLILGPFRWPLYLDPYWKRAYTKVHVFLDKSVAHALEKKQEDMADPAQERYVLLEEMAKLNRNPYELRHQILNVFFPAKDTAAIAFANVIFQLARHPFEWDKLRAEVKQIPSDQVLNYEFIRSLKTTKSIIDESIRLHLPASRISRIALKDSVLPRGGGPNGESPVFVPKGTVLEMDLYTMQRDPTVWGDDSNEFKPSRWRQPNRPLWEAKWQYEPFLGGIRMCPAQNMVFTQVAYLLIRFAQEFKTLENKDKILEYVEKITMTVESRNGVKIGVESV
ncbi:Cytochrome P450 monooxygenase lepH [Lachnellula suecica]|uniref:Cytochrome P450 monooxygenase lepH n=1 Tax=Lachnellula suecica TaxID=602035 RepID=A0A8T9C8U9_9HELO|nr:Cytochrome P450 monooxygenase lepH [Lachnellula suecica]